MPPVIKKRLKLEQNSKKNTLQMDTICEIIDAHITILAGKSNDPQMIVKGCVAMASCKESITGYTKLHDGLPSHTTCLNILHELDMDELVRQSSDMLIKAGKNVIQRGRTYTFAIDKTQDPYYGKRDNAPDSHIVGGKNKKSTNYFFTYLTMSIVDQGRHLTIFSIPWRKGMKDIDAIKQCIELIDHIGLKIRCLCLDREFYVGEIFQYLQMKHIPHIVPVPKRGAGLKAMLKGRKSNTFRYTLNQKTNHPVDLVITDCLVYLKGKKAKHGIEHHAFVVFGISTSPRHIRAVYRHRFAIESTYRIRNTTLPKTTTKDPKIRFFYSLIAFLIQNWWVSIKWNQFARIQRGPKVIKDDRFPLSHLIEIIRAEASNWFRLKGIDEIAITRRHR
jgi:putative transposase